MPYSFLGCNGGYLGEERRQTSRFDDRRAIQAGKCSLRVLAVRPKRTIRRPASDTRQPGQPACVTAALNPAELQSANPTGRDRGQGPRKAAARFSDVGGVWGRFCREALRDAGRHGSGMASRFCFRETGLTWFPVSLIAPDEEFSDENSSAGAGGGLQPPVHLAGQGADR
ncbi:hypothetical protein MASR2M74_19020 [Paracoccaceae bacterium]